MCAKLRELIPRQQFDIPILKYIEQNLKHAKTLDNSYFIEECKLKQLL